MKVTVCIPCHGPKHFRYIPETIKTYIQQSVLPDEIVVAVSSWNDSLKSILQDIAKLKRVPVKIITTTQEQYAGINRNTAASQAAGDILIFSDADDLPSTQRVEIIKQVFSDNLNLHLLAHSYAWDHLHHKGAIYFSTPEDFYSNTYIDIESSLKVTELDPINEPYKYANGVPAITNTLFTKLQWSNAQKGQDLEFMQAGSRLCAQNKWELLRVENILYYYRNRNSSWR